MSASPIPGTQISTLASPEHLAYPSQPDVFTSLQVVSEFWPHPLDSLPATAVRSHAQSRGSDQGWAQTSRGKFIGIRVRERPGVLQMIRCAIHCTVSSD